MEDVPGSGDAVLTLHDGVGVEELGNDDERHVRGHDVVGEVVLVGGGEGDVEEHNPRDTDLAKHLEVKVADTGVQPSAEEEVIEVIAGDVLGGLASDKRVDVDDNGDGVGGDHRDGGEGTNVVDDVGDLKGGVVVEKVSEKDGKPPSSDTVAKVLVALVALGGDGEASDVSAGEGDGHDALGDHEAPIELHGIHGG